MKAYFSGNGEDGGAVMERALPEGRLHPILRLGRSPVRSATPRRTLQASSVPVRSRRPREQAMQVFHVLTHILPVRGKPAPTRLKPECLQRAWDYGSELVRELLRWLGTIPL